MLTKTDIKTISDLMDQKFGTFEIKVDDKFDTFEAKMDTKFKTFESKIESKFDEKIDNLATVVKENFDRVFDKFDHLEGRFDKLEFTVRSEHSRRLDLVEDRVREIKTNIGLD